MNKLIWIFAAVIFTVVVGIITFVVGGRADSRAFKIGEPVAASTIDKKADAKGATKPDKIAAVSPNDAAARKQTAVFAGGCFWGVEAVFEHTKGVMSATSGYSGGKRETADYERVSEGDTGHAEAVEIIYDPAQVSYEQLLKVFFSVAHDPTELNRQGPDTGTQYRSAIFYTSEEQKRIAENYIAEMRDAKVFPAPIVTEINRLDAFYKAEDYHQDYLAHHPTERYIVINDLPKVANLQKQFPELYVEK